MGYNIPKPIMPSKEQLLESAKEWWKIHEKINFLEWNDILKINSYPFKYFKITSDLILDVLNGKNVESVLNIFEEEIYKSGWKNSYFIKLITRSPKDYLDDIGFELKSAQEGFDAIFGSLRCFEDLVQLQMLDKCIFIIRPYIDIPKEREFRVFVEEGKIKGISQYHYTEEYDWIKKNAYIIQYRIENFISYNVIPNLDLSSFVADIVVKDGGSCILLELNPYGLSDPCLFKEYKNLDGKFLHL